MYQKSNPMRKGASPYSAVITREQFLFYEMRTTARLLTEGMTGPRQWTRSLQKTCFNIPLKSPCEAWRGSV